MLTSTFLAGGYGRSVSSGFIILSLPKMMLGGIIKQGIISDLMETQVMEK
jgi:hypothetical protein